MPLRLAIMKSFAVFPTLLVFVTSASVTIKDGDHLENNPAYGYLTKIGAPLAKQIREAETHSNFNKPHRDVKPTLKVNDGITAHVGDVPYQAGLVIDLEAIQSVCGGSLLSPRRVLTAAHCWWDGISQAWRFTVVLGSVKLFGDGTRIETKEVVTHSQYRVLDLHNDIAMVYLPYDVKFSKTILPIALPSGKELQESFVGLTGVASGYGRTKDVGLNRETFLRYIRLQVISNEKCQELLQSIEPSKMCAMGSNSKGTCRGDSGGPFALIRHKKTILIGINSFGPGCGTGDPDGYTRVTYYIDWINSNM